MAMSDEKRDLNEKKFEQLVHDYLKHSEQYRFGGPVNLATTIAAQCDRIGRETGVGDWNAAADLFRGLEVKVDLKY